jgi:hypothetical protein
MTVVPVRLRISPPARRAALVGAASRTVHHEPEPMIEGALPTCALIADHCSFSISPRGFIRRQRAHSLDAVSPQCLPIRAKS